MLRRLCAVVLLVASIPVVLAPSGHADLPNGSTELPALFGTTTSVIDFVVDSAHNRMIVSGPGGIDIAASNGSQATHVSSPAVVAGLALSLDASTLWYGDAGAGALVSTDAAEVATAPRTNHALPNSECPTRLAVDGSDRVWFLYRPCLSPTDAGGLGVYDPQTQLFDLDPPVDAQIPDVADLHVLDNNPATPDTLVVASDSNTTTVDAATGTVHTDTANPSGAGAAAVSSDGTRVARANGELTEAPTAAPGSVDDTARYDPTGMWEDAAARGVALAADDAHIAGAFGSDVVSFGTAQGDQAWIRRCESGIGTVEAMSWVGTTVWVVAEEYSTLYLAHCDAMTTPQSFIAAREVVKPAGTAFSVPMRLAYRDVPIAGATISVARTGPSGTTSLPNLVTDANGLAVVHDGAVRRGHFTYALRYAGDQTYPSGGVDTSVTGTTEPSSFAISGGSRRGQVDRPLTIRNRLISADGTGLAGRTIHVVRRDAAGRHVLPDVVTDRSGRFALTTAPRFGLVTRYYLSYTGEPAYRQAPTASYRVTVRRLRATLSMTLKRPAIWYDQRATVRVHLGRTFQRRSVTLFAAPVDRGRRIVRTGTVDKHGNLTATVPMRRNTKFIAWFKGDPRYNPREVSVTEYSGLRPYVRIGGGYGRSGKYRLYRTNQPIKLIGKLLPAQAWRCLRFNAMHRADGKWVEDGASPCVDTNKHGVGKSYFLPPHPKLGVAYALQTIFDGDKLHTSSRSAAAYAKFTAASASSRAASARASWKGAWTIGR